MAYQFEVFISYKWSGERKDWVDNVFYPIFKEELDEHLEVPPKIFKDSKDVPAGGTLDEIFKHGIAHSKCMVCILSLPYFFKSLWCPTEFSAMLYREERTEIRRNDQNHTGLIFPILFTDSNAENVIQKSPIYQYESLKNLIFNIAPL